MKLYKNLPLVNVDYNENETTATLDFIDKKQGNLLEMVIHTEAYDQSSEKFQPDKGCRPGRETQRFESRYRTGRAVGASTTCTLFLLLYSLADIAASSTPQWSKRSPEN